MSDDRSVEQAKAKLALYGDIAKYDFDPDKIPWADMAICPSQMPHIKQRCAQVEADLEAELAIRSKLEDQRNAEKDGIKKQISDYRFRAALMHANKKTEKLLAEEEAVAGVLTMCVDTVACRHTIDSQVFSIQTQARRLFEPTVTQAQTMTGEIEDCVTFIGDSGQTIAAKCAKWSSSAQKATETLNGEAGEVNAMMSKLQVRHARVKSQNDALTTLVEQAEAEAAAKRQKAGLWPRTIPPPPTPLSIKDIFEATSPARTPQLDSAQMSAGSSHRVNGSAAAATHSPLPATPARSLSPGPGRPAVDLATALVSIAAPQAGPAGPSPEPRAAQALQRSNSWLEQLGLPDSEEPAEPLTPPAGPAGGGRDSDASDPASPQPASAAVPKSLAPELSLLEPPGSASSNGGQSPPLHSSSSHKPYQPSPLATPPASTFPGLRSPQPEWPHSSARKQSPSPHEVHGVGSAERREQHEDDEEYSDQEQRADEALLTSYFGLVTDGDHHRESPIFQGRRALATPHTVAAAPGRTLRTHGWEHQRHRILHDSWRSDLTRLMEWGLAEKAWVYCGPRREPERAPPRRGPAPRSAPGSRKPTVAALAMQALAHWGCIEARVDSSMAIDVLTSLFGTFMHSCAARRAGWGLLSSPPATPSSPEEDHLAATTSDLSGLAYLLSCCSSLLAHLVSDADSSGQTQPASGTSSVHTGYQMFKIQEQLVQVLNTGYETLLRILVNEITEDVLVILQSFCQGVAGAQQGEEGAADGRGARARDRARAPPTATSYPSAAQDREAWTAIQSKIEEAVNLNHHEAIPVVVMGALVLAVLDAVDCAVVNAMLVHGALSAGVNRRRLMRMVRYIQLWGYDLNEAARLGWAPDLTLLPRTHQAVEFVGGCRDAKQRQSDGTLRAGTSGRSESEKGSEMNSSGVSSSAPLSAFDRANDGAPEQAQQSGTDTTNPQGKAGVGPGGIDLDEELARCPDGLNRVQLRQLAVLSGGAVSGAREPSNGWGAQDELLASATALGSFKRPDFGGSSNFSLLNPLVTAGPKSIKDILVLPTFAFLSRSSFSRV